MPGWILLEGRLEMIAQDFEEGALPRTTRPIEFGGRRKEARRQGRGHPRGLRIREAEERLLSPVAWG